MRIISGTCGGRTIVPPKNLRARPTTDFAKENLFNVLGNLIDFEGIDVLDLFAGTGSISYEFASRGAASVTSVEINANVFLYLKNSSKRYDVIFSDAPYDLEGSERVVDMVLGREMLKEDGIFVFEHSKDKSFAGHPRLYDVRNYGSVHFSIFR